MSLFQATTFEQDFERYFLERARAWADHHRVDGRLVEAAGKMGDVIAAAMNDGDSPKARSDVCRRAVEPAIRRPHPKPERWVLTQRRT